jgi:hypothetical protein
MATRRRPAAKRAGNSATSTPSSGIDLVAPQHSSEPPLPHERDEAVGSTGGVPSERMRQGHRDLKRGVQDTSRAPEAGRAYDKLKKK